MIRVSLIFLFVCACTIVQAQTNFIRTIAGNDTAGYGGDNGPAIYASLYSPEGLSLDKWNNIYIADAGNSCIRKINPSTGIIITVAGNDTIGFSGDEGLAINSKLNIPVFVFCDTIGNIYIADGNNNRIRKITVSTGIITTVAGSGPVGGTAGSDSGDNGPATDATLNQPSSICLDKFGNMFIADYSNNKVRKVDASTGVITTFAGTGAIGYSGDSGLAISATFNYPIAVFADSFGNVFISDQYNAAVRKVTASTGIITTFAGNGTSGYSGDSGLAINAEFDQPSDIYIDKQNNIFVADYGNGTIRRIDGITNIITTVAGNGTFGYSGDNGPAIEAELKCTDMFLDTSGNLYIADYNNNRIREVYDTAGLTATPNVEKQNDVVVYPNPATTQLTISASEYITNVAICNLVGQTTPCPLLKTGWGLWQVDVSELPPGMYLIKINGGVVKKFVKQ